MNDISSGKISCLCGWSGTFDDIPLNFKVNNFLICPKCGTEDLIYASTGLEKKFKHRKSFLFNHIKESLVFSELEIGELVPQNNKLSVFVRFASKVYFFETSFDLSEMDKVFAVLKNEASSIDTVALQYIKKQKLSTIHQLQKSVVDIWGELNFITVLSFYKEIAERIEKEINLDQTLDSNGSMFPIPIK